MLINLVKGGSEMRFVSRASEDEKVPRGMAWGEITPCRVSWYFFLARGTAWGEITPCRVSWYFFGPEARQRGYLSASRRQ